MTDHPTCRGLLADILERPEDDTPRLILADWLDDHGDPERAGFIRAQVMVASTGHLDCPNRRRAVGSVAGGPFAPTLSRCGVCDFCRPMIRAQELHRAGAAWFVGEMPFSYAHDCNHWSLHPDWMREHPTLYLWRGFVACARCPLAAWEEHGPALVARHPVERVEVTDDEIFQPLPTQARPETCRIRPTILPSWLWRRFYGDGQAVSANPTWIYDSRREAEDDLSRHLLAWAVAEAKSRGLWPVPSGEPNLA